MSSQVRLAALLTFRTIRGFKADWVGRRYAFLLVITCIAKIFSLKEFASLA
jgi:hypothetical protein